MIWNKGLEKLHITDYLTDKKVLFLNANDEYLKEVNESKEYEIRYYSINELKNNFNSYTNY